MQATVKNIRTLVNKEVITIYKNFEQDIGEICNRVISNPFINKVAIIHEKGKKLRGGVEAVEAVSEITISSTFFT